MTSHLNEFIATIARLRAVDGCPWDQEQTHRSLARYLLEEAYEVLDAIHAGDPEKLKEELGDLLLQVVLNAQVAKDAGQFDIEDVACEINKKMIDRHPHVFSSVNVRDAKEVIAQWEDLKNAQRSDLSGSQMYGIPRSLPALLQALKVSEKAVHQGFEWQNEGDIWHKLFSELDELKAAIANMKMSDSTTLSKAKQEVELEIGDVLFVLVNIARFHEFNPEESLLMAIEKFKQRFRAMEELCERPLKELSKFELKILWNKAKLSTQI